MLNYPVGKREIRLPEKPTIDGLELKWQAKWEEEHTYQFDRGASREQVFAIDTPPPTVSGSLHIGHCFSYTHTDAIARFQRMRGRVVFYPMGWDDNGLATERRVQNYYGVRCDPSLPYTPGFVRSANPSGPPVSISRPNFVELCIARTSEDEKAFEELWRFLGLSIDWSMTYSTIGQLAQGISQRSFLDLLQRGLAFQLVAPTLWDVDFQTAVSLAELEDREVLGAFHRLRFGRGDAQIDIETTRPELLPACVALVAHPDDPRYQPYFGRQMVTPLFEAPVPILPHALADPEKGTGIAMVCTFGDVTDVTWWRELRLPIRPVVQPDGRMGAAAWGTSDWPSENVEAAHEYYSRLEGLKITAARERIVELLRESGALIGDSRPISRAVKFYEKGDRPVEIITSRQWFVKTVDFKDALLERGRELRWHPEYMRTRYENWVAGLSGDWCISRQRFFGVPFPIWYPIGDAGTVDYSRPILPNAADLPIDPSTMTPPPGYREEQRGKPQGFIGDPDVMDTWTTSSLTPEIAGRAGGVDTFARVFPMDLRPQAHDIIRTWLFYTVLRSEFDHQELPWRNAAISGFIVDPDRKKMSKSKGNVVTPLALLKEHGSDGVRYWALRGRPGTDTTFDPGQMRVGRKLAVKLLNASKFALSAPPADRAVTTRVDRGMLIRLASTVTEATSALDDYDYTGALEHTEQCFWYFCDNYVELVKSRRYGDEGAELAASANTTLVIAIDVFLRLFAPFLPFVTEEVWSWWRDGSVHRAEWPKAAAIHSVIGAADRESVDVLTFASDVLSEIRRHKSENKLRLSAPIAVARIKDSPERLHLLPHAQVDIAAAGCVQRLDAEEGSFEVVVEFAPN